MCWFRVCRVICLDVITHYQEWAHLGEFTMEEVTVSQQVSADEEIRFRNAENRCLLGTNIKQPMWLSETDLQDSFPFPT